MENEFDASKEKQFLGQLDSQYEVLWKHLEYVDSHVFKLIGMYLIFVGALIAKIELFLNSKAISSIFVILVGLVFFVFLHRVSRLLQALKKNIKEIDEERGRLHGFGIIPAIPECYAGGPRTSEVGKYATLAFSTVLAAYIIFSSPNPAQQAGPADPGSATLHRAG
jgi:hypothetical protein